MRLTLAVWTLLLATPLLAADGDHDNHAAQDEHAAHDDHSDDHSDHLSEVDGIRILHGWTRATDGDHAMVFMEIENTTSAEVGLIGGDTEIAAEVHLMAVDFKNPGSFVELDEMPIPADSAFPLTPQGVFLELHELAMPLVVGDEFDIHVVIEPVGEIEVHVDVEAADASNHSHAGHNH